MSLNISILEACKTTANQMLALKKIGMRAFPENQGTLVPYYITNKMLTISNLSR